MNSPLSNILAGPLRKVRSEVAETGSLEDLKKFTDSARGSPTARGSPPSFKKETSAGGSVGYSLRAIERGSSERLHELAKERWELEMKYIVASAFVPKEPSLSESYGE